MAELSKKAHSIVFIAELGRQFHRSLGLPAQGKSINMKNAILSEKQTLPAQLKILCVAYVLVCLSNSAFGQMDGGTIVVFFQSSDKVILAADSHLSLHGVNIPPRDDECKLLALNNNLIVATAGSVIGPAVEDLGPNTNDVNMAQKFAREEASKIGPTVRDPARALASAWVDRMTPFVRGQLPNLDSTILAKRQLTHGLFAGMTPSGTMGLYWGTVEWDGHGIIGGARELYSNASVPFRAIGTAKGMIAFKRFVNAKVPPKFLPEWKDRDIAKAVYLAERVRDTAQDEKIAGPIDVLELRTNGTPYWVRRKKNCQPN